MTLSTLVTITLPIAPGLEALSSSHAFGSGGTYRVFLHSDTALATGTQKGLNTFCSGPSDLWVLPETAIF